MEKFLLYFGYSNNLDYKIKVTYVLDLLATSIGSLYLLLYCLQIDFLPAIYFQIIYIFISVSIFFVLKYKYYKLAKFLLLFAFFFNQGLAVFVWFPIETGFYIYFLLVPSSVFLIFRYETMKQRFLTIGTACLGGLVFIISQVFHFTNYMYEVPHNITELYTTITLITTVFPIIYVFIVFSQNLEKLHKELRLLANTDALTQILNRRTLFKRGHEEFFLAQKYEHSFSLILFDVDFFKKVNDEYGHPVGDQLLVQITELVTKSIRKKDLFSRYGGEEFAILMRDTEGNDGYKAACQIAEKIKNKRFMIREYEINITISAGVVQFKPEMQSFDEMIQIADNRMYQGKESGRDIVIYQ